MAGLEASVKFFHRPKNANDAGVSVGWFQDQRYDDGTSVAQVAKWNEFGTKAGVPERPFMRETKMRKEREWIEQLKTLIQKAIDNDKSIELALKQFGEIAKGDIQETILSGGFKPNAASTIKRKGAGKMPLIDTGVMISSIQARTDKELLENV